MELRYNPASLCNPHDCDWVRTRLADACIEHRHVQPAPALHVCLEGALLCAIVCHVAFEDKQAVRLMSHCGLQVLQRGSGYIDRLQT